jgi:hypothetical protein
MSDYPSFYMDKWPRKLWWLRRKLFGETWGEYMQRMKVPGEKDSGVIRGDSHGKRVR